MAAEHGSLILLSPHIHTDAISACAKLNENLAPTNGTFFRSDIAKVLTYVSLETGASHSQNYWIGGSTSVHSQLCPAVSTSGLSMAACAEKLPVLCANSAPNKISGQTDLSPTWQVQVNSGKLAVTG
jgi:hypothetical protein